MSSDSSVGFEVDGVPNTSQVDKQLWQLAETYTPTENNRAFAQGLLDIGATVCKPKHPECEACCFKPSCIAFSKKRVHELPAPKPKKDPSDSGRTIFMDRKKWETTA
ncbi:hypothetical protein P4S72_10545 [Vibrio sp. PP-XX7]